MTEQRQTLFSLNSLSTVSKISQQLEQLSCRAKLSLAHQLLEKLQLKFPRLVDFSVFKELDCIALLLEGDFIQQRTASHLFQLAYSIALVRKKLSQEISLQPLKSYYDTRLMTFSLQFTFSSKSVLGILAHAHLQDKYKVFDEEHILLKIRKLISEAQLVKGSAYAFQPPKSSIKTLYFEIDKKSGLPFTSDEIKRLKAFLKQEIEHCVEKLVPSIFMARNEEEVLKNILTLSREIQHPLDFPEVMILLDQQTTQEAIFTILVVQVASQDSSSLPLCFSQIHDTFTFVPERSQTVRYLNKEHPIDAHIFRIHLPKDPSILRADLSINFYLARQKICTLLTQAIGDFRDFNGGIILKQREALNTFIDAHPSLSSQNPDLLETFFHSINPIEAQASLPIASLKNLFELFLAAQAFSPATSSDYFFQFHQNDQELFFMIRLPETTPKASLDKLLSKLTQSQIITTTLLLQSSIFFGCLISSIDQATQQDLKDAISKTLADWKQTLESLKILKLGLEHPVVSLDPRVGGDHVSSILLKLLFEGLMRENKDGKIEHGIAESVDVSPDLKTYLFKLRSARWSDGSLVTAFDFEYAWKKVLTPSFKTPFAYLFYPIKNAQHAKNGTLPPETIGIHALNGKTLKIELTSPTPYFLELTAHPIYSPVHRLIDQLHPNWPFEEESSYVCNGAFQLVKNNPYQGYELVKNSLYWDAKSIELDQVSFVKMNRYQAIEKFKENNNHWIGIPLCIWDPLFRPSQNDEPVRLLNYPARWITFNCSKPPFSHKKMRQAFSMAIDRIQIALLFNTQPTISPLQLMHSLIQQPFASHFDTEKAKALFNEALEEMKLRKQDLLSITFIHLQTQGALMDKLFDTLKSFWESTFGIECVFHPLPWDSLFSKLTEGNYQIGYTAWQSWVNDPMYTFNAFRHAQEPVNFAKWENQQYQEFLHMAEREVLFEKRQNYYLKAEEILLDEMPVVSIFANPLYIFKKRRLNIQTQSCLINFKWAYFESS